MFYRLAQVRVIVKIYDDVAVRRVSTSRCDSRDRNRDAAGVAVVGASWTSLSPGWALLSPSPSHQMAVGVARGSGVDVWSAVMAGLLPRR